MLDFVPVVVRRDGLLVAGEAPSGARKRVLAQNININVTEVDGAPLDKAA